MTNKEKYRSFKDGTDAFRAFCLHYNSTTTCSGCPAFQGHKFCFLNWLKLEAEEEKPLNCPCCGGASLTRHGDSGFYYVQCDDCQLMTGDFDTKAEAIAAWNRRAKRNRRAK